MNLTGRAPYQKPAKAAPNPAYLAKVRALPCCICQAFGERQTSATAAHHPIHGRYGARKVPDIMALPLCEGHHQGLFDTTKLAIHRAPSEWRNKYGPDTDWIAPTQDRLGVK